MDIQPLVIPVDVTQVGNATGEMGKMSNAGAHLEDTVTKLAVANAKLTGSMKYIQGASSDFSNETDKLVKRQDAFLQSLDRQAATMGKGAAAMREYEAEQLGLTDDKIYQKLNQQITALEGISAAAKDAAKSEKEAGDQIEGMSGQSLMNMAFGFGTIAGAAEKAFEMIVDGLKEMVNAIPEAIEATNRQAIAFEGLSFQTGDNFQKLSTYATTLRLVGGSMDDLTGWLRGVTMMMRTHADVFVDAGIAADQYALLAMKPIDVLERAVEVIANTTDQNRRLVLEQEMIGRSGIAQIPLMKRFFATLEEGGEVQKKYGHDVTSASLETAHAAETAEGIISTKMNAIQQETASNWKFLTGLFEFVNGTLLSGLSAVGAGFHRTFIKPFSELNAALTPTINKLETLLGLKKKVEEDPVLVARTLLEKKEAQDANIYRRNVGPATNEEIKARLAGQAKFDKDNAKQPTVYENVNTQYGNELDRLHEQLLALSQTEREAYEMKLKLMDNGAGGDVSEAMWIYDQIEATKQLNRERAATAAADRAEGVALNNLMQGAVEANAAIGRSTRDLDLLKALDLGATQEQAESYADLKAASRDAQEAIEAKNAAMKEQESLRKEAIKLNTRNNYTSSLEHLNALNATGLLAPDVYREQLHKLLLESQTIWGAIAYSVENFADRGSSALANFFNGTKTGFREMVSSMLLDLEKLILKQQVVEPLLQGAGSWFSGMLGGSATVNTGESFILNGIRGAGTRAIGGPVSSGETYLVGEKGPELFTPRSSGHITPNNALGGQTNNVSINVNVAQDGTAKVTSHGMASLASDFEASVLGVIQKHQRPGGSLNPVYS